MFSVILLFVTHCWQWVFINGERYHFQKTVTKFTLSGQILDTFHTFYNLETDFIIGQRGLTLKREMIQPEQKFKEMTICFRIKMDFFTIIGDYIPIIDVLDGGGWVNGVEVEKFQERTFDFRIRCEK